MADMFLYKEQMEHSYQAPALRSQTKVGVFMNSKTKNKSRILQEAFDYGIVDVDSVYETLMATKRENLSALQKE